jgi:hypothetical protein
MSPIADLLHLRRFRTHDFVYADFDELRGVRRCPLHFVLRIHDCILHFGLLCYVRNLSFELIARIDRVQPHDWTTLLHSFVTASLYRATCPLLLLQSPFPPLANPSNNSADLAPQFRHASDDTQRQTTDGLSLPVRPNNLRSASNTASSVIGSPRQRRSAAYTNAPASLP